MATKTTEPENPTEILVPSAEHREVTIGQEPLVWEFTQKPLSFFQKMEVFSVLGSALDKAMSGPNGLSLGELFDGPSPLEDDLNPQNFRDADTFVKAIAKLVQYAPELLSDLYLVILGVSRGQRDLVKDAMERPESEGGLSDEDGIGILETFVDQNWEVMVDFFTVRVQPLIKKISSKVQDSQPSKPSKITQRVTQSQ